MSREQILSTLKSMDEKTRLRLGMVLAAILLVLLGLSAVNGRIATLQKKKLAREADVVEMLQLKVRYQAARAVSQRLTSRMLVTRPDDSPAKIIEETGIKGRSSQIKPVKGDDLPGFVEDAADVKIEGLTANEAMNLLYKLEKGGRPVTVKKLLVKPRFDDPSKIDLNLTVALIKPAPAGGK
ncbi:general secretion pathway protein GspM [Geomesophilobacter sediminis]|uniref:General secretion pathway protein GspM n=1 Tax=Geomesophilobacter sediminis TaxID=2798584 RepID=A0A8J7S8U5_9BACT|nr:general secretion pathway protein GspM [Geomesophilobacter sediminis]MBJ6726636.1 general secretion pathway protein GspM [Geomesophilobacter sediminis]